MSAKLSYANPYLRDRDVRERTVVKSVSTSSAIEGIRTLLKLRTKTNGTRGRAKQGKS